jgi:MYXO-CTERM domain-containing protein
MLLAGSDRRSLVAECFASWSGNACTDIQYVDVGTSDQLDGFDPMNIDGNRNVIVAIENASLLSHLGMDPSLLALTLTHYSVQTGEIFDADILINAVQHSFQDITDMTSCVAEIPSGKAPYDLRNTLTHEMGHFSGLCHVAIPDATMFASADPCEIKKRTLAQDDINGICFLYPRGQPARTCSPPAGGYDDNSTLQDLRSQCSRLTNGGIPPAAHSCGCSTTEEKGAGASALLAVLVLFGLYRRFATTGR